MRAQERRTNDDPILKEKEESVFFSLKIEERSAVLDNYAIWILLQRESLLRVRGIG